MVKVFMQIPKFHTNILIFWVTAKITKIHPCYLCHLTTFLHCGGMIPMTIALKSLALNLCNVHIILLRCQISNGKHFYVCLTKNKEKVFITIEKLF